VNKKRYIIDNYHSLPDNILFIHPTRYQWHNDDPDYDGLPMLRHFQLPHLEAEGYVNIRCAWSLGCPAEIKPFDEEGQHRENVHAGGDYKKAFQILFPGRKVPNEVGVGCCAQFAATREKIWERGRGDYVRYREWLVETELGDAISGRIMEYSWHSKLCLCFLSCCIGRLHLTFYVGRLYWSSIEDRPRYAVSSAVRAASMTTSEVVPSAKSASAMATLTDLTSSRHISESRYFLMPKE
jgi:hypothetical protein